jgi:predicted O-linked N-acetylglucosamine transferase (SPINDLY family)
MPSIGNDQSQAKMLAATVLQNKFEQGVAFHQQGKLTDAARICREVLQQQPNHFDAAHLLGVIALQTGHTEGAVELFGRAITLRPTFAEAHNNRGAALHRLKRYEQALDNYDKAVLLKPSDADAHYNRGLALAALKRHDNALESYDKAVALRPDHAESHSNRGHALDALNRADDALKSYDKAIELKPDLAEVYNNRGCTLIGLNRCEEALASFTTAIALKPNFVEAYNNRGKALSILCRYAEALRSYEKALEFRPDFIKAYVNRGDVLRTLKLFNEATVSFERALHLQPEHEFLHGELIYTKMINCDWNNFKNDYSQLVGKIRSGEKVSKPFPILAIDNFPELQRKAAEIYALANYPPNNALPAIAKRPRGDKIRIGYFSADFRDHPGAYSMVEMFERHDRTKFEIIAFSFSPMESYELRSRLESAFDKFIDVNRYSDLDVARLARSMEIDIAIDRNGFTTYCRTNIFALRAAPLQVSYKGYSGTMGTDYIDYLIADRIVVPCGDRQHYSEKIAYLPNCYQVYDTKRNIPERTQLREELGLPPKAFVFCCFNSNYKITPGVFDSWMRILQQVDGSILWLLEGSASAAINLRKEAAARDISPERLVFAKRMFLPDHLARYRLADLFIDTLPYNAHTTASEALWAGLPVLTQIGTTFAGRVAASLLTAIGLPELVTSTQQAYEDRAIELATNRGQLAEIRKKLANNRLTAPLFDTKLFTGNLEAAFIAMYERYQAGLPPDHIYIPQ